MIMRTVICVAIIAAVLATAARASMFTIGIGQDGTNQTLTVGSRPVTPKQLVTISGKLASLSRSQFVLVRLDPNTRVEGLLWVLRVIKDAGLRNVYLVPIDGQGGGVLSLELLPGTNELIRAMSSPSPLLEWESIPKIPEIETKSRTKGCRATSGSSPSAAPEASEP